MDIEAVINPLLNVFAGLIGFGWSNSLMPLAKPANKTNGQMNHVQ